MQAWLLANWGVLAGIVIALSSGYIGLNRKRDRQLAECRQKCEKQAKTIVRARRDLKTSYEFNIQDRYTIRRLAMMVRDYESQLKLPPRDILLHLYEEAEAEMKARQLAAQADLIHRTYPTADEDEQRGEDSV